MPWHMYDQFTSHVVTYTYQTHWGAYIAKFSHNEDDCSTINLDRNLK